MSDDEAPGWSAVAERWTAIWGDFARPAQEALIEAAGVNPGTRVLDVGCGTGEFLARLRARGADATGVDPSAGMRDVAARSGFDIRPGDAEHLPFADGSFDVVTAVDAVHLTDDLHAALRECVRVVRPGGRVALATWAEGARNDVDVIARAVALADQTDPPTDDALRLEGGLESAVAATGLRVTASGLVDAPWRAGNEEALVTGILLGEDEAFRAEMFPVVVAAAAPFRDGEGFVLRNALRWAVGVLDE